jgi:HEAT repeat protein
MIPRSTIAGIAAVLLATLGAIAPAQQTPPQTDTRVPTLIASLGGRYGDKAAEELVAIGEPAVAPLLAELRAGGGRAQLACLPLARIGTSPAVDGAIAALRGADLGVAESAAAALRFVKTARSADALSEALARDTGPIRRAAALSLAVLGDARAVDPLRGGLQSTAWYIREETARALGTVRIADAAALLVSALDDQNGEVRFAVREALVAQGDVAAGPAITALDSPSDRVRWQAAWTLGRLAAEGAVARLLQAIEDPDPVVRRESAVALGRITAARPAKTETLVEAVAGRLRHADPDVRVHAAWLLGELGSARAAAALVSALGDGASAWTAAAALGALAAPEAAVPLARALRSDEVRVRRAAAWALNRLQNPATVAALRPSLGDPDAEVRYWAATVLRRLGTPDATSALAAARPTPWDRGARRCAPPRSAAVIASGTVSLDGRHYRLYPDVLDARPDLPSPLTAADGTELVLAFLQNGKYGIVPATLKEADGQCRADGRDFPTLEATGLHSVVELERARIITGRSVGEIADLARPGALSTDGFLAADEEVVDVLKDDNRTVSALGLTHADLARPLFHVWNMMGTDLDLGRWNMSTHRWGNVTALMSHGRLVTLAARDSKGGQFSIFADGLDGAFTIEIDTALTDAEQAFLRTRYPRLEAAAMDALVQSLTRIRTGEIQPHYVMWYGFYEGTTPWRTDPVALAFVFGLRTLEQIEAAFPGRLYEVLMRHRVPAERREPEAGADRR